MFFELLRETTAYANDEIELILLAIAARDGGDGEWVRLQTAKSGQGQIHMLTRLPSERNATLDREEERVVADKVDAAR